MLSPQDFIRLFSTEKHLTYLTLADYRRRVAELYAGVRTFAGDPQERWRAYVQGREALLGRHPQSALSEEQRAGFTGLRYFPYNPDLCLLLPLEPPPQPGILEVELGEDGLTRLERIGSLRFQVGGQPASLTVFWIQGYGGGLFLPFRDATNQTQSYGGGRYLLDTIKGADLGLKDGKLLIDFNYAYNPSCAYHPRWICPRAPRENWLSVPLLAGEMRYQDS
jgi:uncharacterized protein (DUF1684 family)